MMEESEHESTTFEFSGGWVCLDFCNTADGNLKREWKENLHSYEDILLWSKEAGIINEEEYAHLLHSASEHPANAAQVLKIARALRQTMTTFSRTSLTKQRRNWRIWPLLTPI
jgi:hypothetical protein